MKRFIIIKQLDGSEQQFTEQDLPLTIGPTDDNHIVLPESDFTGAYIGSSQGHLYIQAARHIIKPLFHNDRQLTESAWLKSTDVLSCEPYVVQYKLRGDRSIFSVTKTVLKSETPVLSPPLDAPPGLAANGDSAEDIPVDITKAKITSRRKKIALGTVGLGFVLLVCAVLFVLWGRPLELEITPAPDTVSVSGVPPAVKLGEHYLMVPGDYTITIAKKGYVTFKETLHVNKSSDSSLNIELQKLPGILNLLVTPSDGVKIHSGSDLLGTTPPTKINIPPGNHQLTLSKDRYKPFTTDIMIEGEEIIQDLEVTLRPDWADIVITSEPVQASVYVDGTDAGRTPITVQLLSGDHNVVLKEAPYVNVTQTINVQAGADKSYTFQLKPLPAHLSLSSTPPGAVVSIDNEFKGSTPLDLTLQPDMVHQLKLSHSGYKPLTHQLTLSPGQVKKIQLGMEQEQGTLFLTITPPNAAVTINGKSFANIQGQLSLPASPQKIVISSPGYKSVSRTFTPNPGFSQQIVIDLVPELHSTHPKPIVSKLSEIQKNRAVVTPSGQKLVYVKPAPFTMGAPRRESGRRANERERKIIMQKPFLIGEKLVTNQEYRKFDKSHNSGAFSGHSLNGDKQPVVNLNWNQAVAYLNWLSEQDNLQPFYVKQGDRFIAASPATTGYRLPTEAEWAYSARKAENKDNKRYPWAGDFPPRTVVANLGDESARTILPRVLAGYNDSFPVTSPVGFFPANKVGLYDMGGNASEWCHDFYSAYTGRLADSPDPLGPSTGTHKVIRGSSWRDASITEMRLSYRAYHKEARNNVGFRIVRYP